jgi:hypothetical protein
MRSRGRSRTACCCCAGADGRRRGRASPLRLSVHRGGRSGAREPRGRVP